MWRTGKELASLAASLQTAVQNVEGNKDFLLSLWDGVNTWTEFKEYCPPDLKGVVHLTYPGFNLASGLSPTIVNGGASTLSELYVALDPFREKDGGWTRMLSAPGQTWSKHLQAAHAHNVTGVLAFANWSPTWSWPNWDTHNFLVNSSGHAPVTWADKYPTLRAVNTFEGLPTGTEFRAQELAGELFSRFAVNVTADHRDIISNWAQGYPLRLSESSAGRLVEVSREGSAEAHCHRLSTSWRRGGLLIPETT